MKKLLMMVLTLACAAGVAGADMLHFGWETGSPDLLGMFGTGDPPIIATVATSPVYAGGFSLQLEDNSPSGTPQAYICWIRGLQDGDLVTAGFWRYDDTPGASPSVRIWGHWNDNPDDINGYNGSASGNLDYGEGLGWDYTEFIWIVEGGHTGLVIEARTYSSPGDTVWIDNFSVCAPEGTIIMIPDGTIAVEAGTWSQLKALY